MIKQVCLIIVVGLLLSTGGSMLIANDTSNCTCNVPELTTADKVIIVCFVGGVIVVATPYVVGAGTVAKIVVAAKATASYVIPKTVVGQVGLGLTAAQMARPLVLQTTEEKLGKLLEEGALKPAKSKAEFISCLKLNKVNSPRNASGRPVACEDAAFLYALNSSFPELNKKTEAFKNGRCFCD